MAVPVFAARIIRGRGGQVLKLTAEATGGMLGWREGIVLQRMRVDLGRAEVFQGVRTV